MVVDQLAPVLDRLIAVLGLEVCHGKGDLSRYGVPYYEPPAYQANFFDKHGISGALLPIGDAFLELIAPLRTDTPIAKYLKRHGPGGYMLVTEVDKTTLWRERIAALGLRIAGFADYPTYDEIQVDPRDIGGSILSFAMQRQGQPFDGSWFPAGHEWRLRAAAGWSGIEFASLSLRQPVEVAARWSALIGRPFDAESGGLSISLDESHIKFIKATENTDRLSAIGIVGSAYGAALERARPNERSPDGKAIRIAGFEFQEAVSCN